MADELLYDEPAASGTTEAIAVTTISSQHYQHMLPGVHEDVPGLTKHFDADGDNTAQQVKASAGNVYGIHVSNLNARTCFLQLFAASSVTVGTTTPNLVIAVPPGDGVDIYGQVTVEIGPIAFATAIKYACTTTPTGSGDPTVGLVVNVLYA